MEYADNKATEIMNTCIFLVFHSPPHLPPDSIYPPRVCGSGLFYALEIHEQEEKERTRMSIWNGIEAEGTKKSLRREVGKQLWWKDSWLKGEGIYEVLMWSI